MLRNTKFVVAHLKLNLSRAAKCDQLIKWHLYEFGHPVLPLKSDFRATLLGI
jgi:hypothetical protein